MIIIWSPLFLIFKTYHPGVTILEPILLKQLHNEHIGPPSSPGNQDWEVKYWLGTTDLSTFDLSVRTFLVVLQHSLAPDHPILRVRDQDHKNTGENDPNAGDKERVVPDLGQIKYQTWNIREWKWTKLQTFKHVDIRCNYNGNTYLAKVSPKNGRKLYGFCQNFIHMSF